MKHFFILRITCWGLLLLLVAACSGGNSLKNTSSAVDPIARLHHDIDALLSDSIFAQSNAGIKIMSLDRDEILYSHNSNKLFHPASNMKLLTTATALKRLGPDFRYLTLFYADSAAIRDSTLNGNLYVKGFGNPDFTSDDLNWMAAELKSQGIIAISGDIICDDSYFDDLFWGSGWMWDDASAWYWAPISALTINDNCVELTVKPGAAVGDPLIATLTPQTSFMQINNNAATVAESDSALRKEFKAQRRWKQPENVIDISGGRYLSDSPRTYTIDVIDAALFFGTLLKERLIIDSITVAGNVVRGRTPENGELLVQHLSPSMTDVVINTNKISDNLSAENLLKTIGAEMRGLPGTAENGISEIYKLLDEAGVDSTSYELADGSGVSRYNVVTADLLIALLKAMHEDFRIQAEFKTSLPIAGVDGTLSRRMHGTAAYRNLRAKTGSLRGVSSLSGYTTTAEDETLAFAMIMEHFVVPTSQIRKLQDKIGDLISSFRREVETAKQSGN